MRRNHDHKVVLFRVVWRSLGLDVHGLVWVMMVTLGEVDFHKVLVNNGVVREAYSGAGGCWL